MRNPGAEQGFVGLSYLLVTLLLFTGALVALLLVADVAATYARARTAADGAALAGMATSYLTGGDGEPERAAREVAARNGAQLVRIEQEGWPLRLDVTVTARPASPLLSGIGHRVTARSSAGLRLKAYD